MNKDTFTVDELIGDSRLAFIQGKYSESLKLATQDEFDSYSHKLAKIISEKDTVKQIAALISNTLDKAFGEEVKPEKFMETAQKIKAALKNN